MLVEHHSTIGPLKLSLRSPSGKHTGVTLKASSLTRTMMILPQAMRFWRFVKHRKQDTQGVAPLKKNGKLVDDPVDKANILNSQFQLVFSAQNPLSLKTLSMRAANFIKPDGTPNDTP